MELGCQLPVYERQLGWKGFDAMNDAVPCLCIHAAQIGLRFSVDRHTKGLNSPLSCLPECRLRIFQRVFILVLIIQWSSVAQQHEDAVLGFPRHQLRRGVPDSGTVSILMTRSQATKPMRRRRPESIVKIFDREKLDLPSALARVGIESILITDGIQRFTQKYQTFFLNVDHPPTGSEVSAG